MAIFPKQFPGRHALMLFIVLVFLGLVSTADFMLMEDWHLIDALWIIPIIFAAVFLTPLETVAVSLTACIISLFSTIESQLDINILSSSLILVTGIVTAIIAAGVKRFWRRVSVVLESVEVSPLAYAEFRFPGYSLTNFNQAFMKMTELADGPGPRTSLADSFQEDSAALLSRFMDDAVNKKRRTDCGEFHLPTVDGRNTFWSMNFIPIIPVGGRTPKTVALFAFEITEAVTRARTREAALRISAQAMSSLHLEDTIRVVMDGLAYIAGTNAGALFLLEEDQWVGKAGYGEFSDESIVDLRFPYEDVLSGVEAVESKQTLAVEEAESDDRFSQDHMSSFKVKSIMTVPMIAGNRPVGVVFLASTDQTRRFTEEQVKFATIIGSHAALAVDNALIYENERTMRKSLEAIEVVSEAGLVSIDLEEVLIELVTRTQDVMHMDAAMIMLWDEGSGCLVGRAATGRVPSGGVNDIKLKPGEGLAGRVYGEGAPLKIDNIRGHEQELFPPGSSAGESLFGDDTSIVSVLAVPLRAGGKTIGVLQAGSRQEAAFTAREWGLIQVLADRSSMAVQNSMLHDKTIRELSRLELLREVASACAASLDLKTIAETVLRAVFEHLGCKIASIYYLDHEQQALVNLAYIGHPEEVRRDFRLSPLDRGTLLTRAVRERRMITHEEVNIDNATESEAKFLKIMDIGYNRCTRMPIIFRDEVVGAMALVFSDTRPFTTPELETIKSVADQLAVAFKNAELAEDV